MFYPCLENLKKKFSNQTVDLFDWWLGTRRSNVRKNINPLQFSLDCDIDIEYTLKLFSYSTFDPSIQLFKRKFVTYCPFCDHRVITQYDEPNFENSIECRNCGVTIPSDMYKTNTELYFELLISPNHNQDQDIPPIGANQKKQKAFGCPIY
ncbi:hypothetical protein ABE112_27420 [Priestia aryabhattai]|uniref:hypothetical protein n=1 Tax=Priestia TaxID=2800373 RepID=UPI001E55B63A|nr:hypothetical protein [Priestia megaterium]MCE4092797.1 hypothetical protein [Priestia megaterium]